LSLHYAEAQPAPAVTRLAKIIVRHLAGLTGLDTDLGEDSLIARHPIAAQA
jgi:hypothetical protein